MFAGHFYHETIRRAVAVFGTLFNNMNVVRRDGSGNVLEVMKVPLSYGPKQKFLARLDQEASLVDPKVAIKLPRMSFEITSLSYDTNTKMAKGQRQRIPTEDGSYQSVLGPVGYRMGMQLNIIAKNQDDALQMIEQIIPFFQPDYTVTVKQVNDNFKSDMPFVLQGVTMNDDYEGDFTTRRAIIYTLDFETRVRFYGPLSQSNTIKRTTIDILNQNTNALEERQLQVVNPLGAEPGEEYNIDVSYSFGATPKQITVDLEFPTIFEVGEVVIGAETGTQGQVLELTANGAVIYKPDGLLLEGEDLLSQDDIPRISQITSVTEEW